MEGRGKGRARSPPKAAALRVVGAARMAARMTEPTDRLSVDSHGAGALALLGGVRPAAPAWFDAALAREPERSRIEVAGAGIEVLAWGRRGDPGLLFLHGNGAHADWWSPLAPFFVDAGHRVAALSWSGMGGSDWRPSYSADMFAEEALAACAHAGLFDDGARPVIAAHSFGGFIGLHCAAHHGARFRAVVTIDSPVHPPDHKFSGPPMRSRPNRLYGSFEETLGRFRLAPPQPCENLWYLDHVGRGSIKAAEEGFTWKFDPFVFREMSLGDRGPMLSGAACPLAVMWGDRSGLVTPEVLAYMSATAPAGTPFVAIPEADHHVMLDQPLPFVAALTGLLAGWPHAGPVAGARGAV